MIVLGTRLHTDTIVHVHAKTLVIMALEAAQIFLDTMRFGKHRCALVFRLPDRHDYHLNRRKLWCETQPRIIAVRHHQTTDHARRYTPTRVPCKRFRALLVLELEIERLREILAEVVRRASLQRFVVLHHRFAGIRTQRTGKFLGICLLPRDHRHRHVLFHERPVDTEHLARLDLGFIMRCVRRVSFLPQEFHRAQK